MILDDQSELIRSPKITPNAHFLAVSFPLYPDDAHPVPEGAVSYVSDLYKDSLDSIKSLEDNEEARKVCCYFD